MPYSYIVPLINGSLPVTFDLIGEPSGMTINNTNGNISWPNAIPNVNPYFITAIASNRLGSAYTRW